MFAPLFSENTAVQPGHRSATLCWLSGLRPHSSPDPFGATLPPGEGFGGIRTYPLSCYTGLHSRWSAGAVPPALRYKNPPFPEKRGISITFCSSRYAERRPSYPYNAGSHVFYSSFDKHHVGQFGSRHCRATGRAVSARLTARKIHQARVCPQGLPAKIPRPYGRGIVCQVRLLNYSWGPAATRALPSSLPVYLAKFLMKRSDRSLAFSSQMEASA